MKELGEDDVINSPEFKKAEKMQLAIEAKLTEEEAKKKKLRNELDQIVENSGDDENQIEEEKKGDGDHIKRIVVKPGEDDPKKNDYDMILFFNEGSGEQWKKYKCKECHESFKT